MEVPQSKQQAEKHTMESQDIIYLTINDDDDSLFPSELGETVGSSELGEMVGNKETAKQNDVKQRTVSRRQHYEYLWIRRW